MITASAGILTTPRVFSACGKVGEAVTGPATVVRPWVDRTSPAPSTRSTSPRWAPDPVRGRPLLAARNRHHRRPSSTGVPVTRRVDVAQRGEHRTIGPAEPWRGRPPQRGDFMAQHQQFDVRGRRGSAEQHQPTIDSDEVQVHQPQRHASRSWRLNDPTQSSGAPRAVPCGVALRRRALRGEAGEADTSVRVGRGGDHHQPTRADQGHRVRRRCTCRGQGLRPTAPAMQ